MPMEKKGWRFALTALPYWKIVGYGIYITVFMLMTDGLNDYPPEELMSAVYKVLPAIHLIFICYSTEYDFQHFYSYRQKIMLGLLVSAGGDACLVWRHQLFIPGLLFFALAQVCYARAFGMRPTGKSAGVVCLVMAGAAYLYLLPGIQEPELKALSLLYLLLIFFMTWRAWVLYMAAPSVGSLCGCIGAFLFVISDFTIAYCKWTGSLEKEALAVMASYYTAQLFIAMSVASYHAPPWAVTEDEKLRHKKQS